MKSYCTFLILLFAMLWNTSVFGQIVANNQNAYLGPSGGSVSLYQYVTLNGQAVSNSEVTFYLINSGNTGIYVDGSNLVVNQGLPSGNYSVTYQVCETANSSNCTTAILTVNICYLTYLIINPVNVHCGIGDGYEIQNMPWGDWTLTINHSFTIQGSGPTYTFFFAMYPQEYYFFEVTDAYGCSINSGVSYAQEVQHIPLTIVPQTCNAPASSLTLTDLPEGNWTLYYRKQNNQANVINGTGTSYTLTGLSSGIYSFTVWNELGCNSEEKSTSIGFISAYLGGTLSGTYVDYNNDGITNLGDIIQYTASITNSINCMMDTLTYNIGNAPYTSGTFNNIPAGATVYATINYVLTQDDINQAHVLKTLHINGLANGFNYLGASNNQTPVILTVPDGIKLTAFFDSNNDGIQNNNESEAFLGHFVYQINNDGINHNLYSSNENNLIYESDPLATYDFSYNINSNCIGQYNVSNLTFNDITVPPGSGVTNYNFPITQNAFCQDIQISILGSIPPRPGFTKTLAVIFSNNGNLALPNGTVTFALDSALEITNISEPTAILTSTGFTYNFANLLPNETRTIYVTIYTPTIPNVSLGQLVTNSASITLPEQDHYSNNNFCSLTQTIGGSYDPNEKTEAHGGKIVHSGFTADDYFTYTIRFENTGTAEAINIRVEDVLDNKLDENSIKMIRASHNYTLDRIGTYLTWRFDGINLPPSVAGDDVTGHGYVVFQVKPKAGFALGDVIPNTANIYFDFNPAIVTNTCTTEFVPFLGVDVFENGSLDYYPNPTSGMVSFAMKNALINNIEITDLLGKTLLVKAVQNAQATIDLSSLTSGVYFAKISSGTQEKTVKLIRQ